MEKNQDKIQYEVYKIGYTDFNGKRTVAEVSEESKAKALFSLEEALINLGYSEKKIEKMCPVLKKTDEISSKTYIKFNL